ncbi:1-aminocyclopropane-1-carboxylate deaminase/D-cysteine desulfhydrase [Thalassotalea profundi]|uniref:1-aminocyclopropane-1-carboxylate deaminase n=1 Tax=Thalassotalea profundi TaxID=2036687 RepID=A0ABQ3J4J7_9GAMM|nr:pyridoxal-phosphate dependent enzyme [Thalassotalea profundi]GHE99070.1 1-aminocyclopropane-1-carboxylate deaminase [Thalassotalea profundi]
MKNISRLQTLNHPLFARHQVKVSIKRDDQIHPIISGNKWRKLKYNLQYAKLNQYKGIISFGGCYSNHLHALAYACQQQQLKALAIVRGESINQDNYTLSWAKHWGMQLSFVDRQTYRQRHETDYLYTLQQLYPDHFLVPEGGSNQLALEGIGEIINELNQQTTFDHLLVPVGSGGTLAGLIKQDNNQHNILGIAVLKQSNYLLNEVKTLLKDNKSHHRWSIENDYHGGGYAKFSTDNANKILQFSKETGVQFEPIYSGKMLLGFLDLLENGYFNVNQHIVLLHTGGLQGIAGLVEQNRLSASEWPLPPAPPAW